jgi:hypothetical protein
MDKEMERLELLSLVNRVSQEIFNFTGNQDKTLAEFVISVSVCVKRGTCQDMRYAVQLATLFPIKADT